MEEFGAAQPVAERVLHQTAQGTGPSGQGTLLDRGPGVGADVRRKFVQASAPRLPPQVSTESGRDPDRRRRRSGWLPIVAVPPTHASPSPPPEPPAATPSTTTVATAPGTATGADRTAATATGGRATSSAAAAAAVGTAAVLSARPVRPV